MQQISRNDKRYYKVHGAEYPSITTILSTLDKEGIAKWRAGLIEQLGEQAGTAEADRISKESIERGNTLHRGIEDYLKNNRTIPDPLFQGILPHIQRISAIQAIEAPLYSDGIRMAGTVDCIGQYTPVYGENTHDSLLDKSLPCIIDFKNSRKPKQEHHILKYFLQGTAYSIMWQERTGQAIEHICILIAVWDGTIQAFVRPRKDYVDKLLQVVSNYHVDQGR